MNTKKTLLRFLLGNATYDRLLRLNLIEGARVTGHRARYNQAVNKDRAPYEGSVDDRDTAENAVPDHLRWQMLGEMPRNSMVHFDFNFKI